MQYRVSSPEMPCPTEPRNSCPPSSPVFSPAPLSLQSLARARARADDCLVRTEGRNARRQPLVLPHRACHQTPLLVSAARKAKSCADRRAESARLRKAGRAESGGAPTPRSVADAHAELPAARPASNNRRNSGRCARDAGDAGDDGATQCESRRRALRAAIGRRLALARTVERRRSATGSPTVTTELGRDTRRRPGRCGGARRRRRSRVPLRRRGCHRKASPARSRCCSRVMTGALALAGITASVVFKFGGARAHVPGGASRRDDDLGTRPTMTASAVRIARPPDVARRAGPAFAARSGPARPNRAQDLPNRRAADRNAEFRIRSCPRRAPI